MQTALGRLVGWGLLCMGWTCGCFADQTSTAKSNVAKVGSAPTSQPAGENAVNQGLVLSLTKPIWDSTADGWRHFFHHGSFRKPFDLQQRDEVVRNIGRAVREHAERSELRVLILEQIAPEGMYVSYGRAAMAASSKPLPREFAELGIVQVAEQPWHPVQGYVEELLRVGGQNNGIRRMSGGPDAFVLTYFDGNSWHTDTWFCITSPDFVDPDRKIKRPVDLPRHMQAYFSLLHYIDTKLAPCVSFRKDVLFLMSLEQDERLAPWNPKR